MRVLRLLCAGTACAMALAMGVAACGGSPTGPSPGDGGGGGNPGGGGGGGPINTTTITITSAGVNPSAIIVSPGARVTFVNNDSVEHEIGSDPHPSHVDCPEIDQAGFLQPNQSRQTGNLNTIRTCGYHDHRQPEVQRFRGTIHIQ